MGRLTGRATRATAVLLAVACLPATAWASPPSAGTGPALFGGTNHVLVDEAAMGRTLDVVRMYTRWDSGPVLSKSTMTAVTGNGVRTLLVSTTISWDGWKAEADRRNADTNPGNDLPVPYCKFRPVVPGTTTPSGKTWWRAVADGDYDAKLRTWLVNARSTVGTAPELYVSLQHEMDRLGKDAATRAYQACTGGPAEFKAAWARMRKVAQGSAGGAVAGVDLTTASPGRIRFVPIFTGWGFWHTADGDRPLVNPDTGDPLAGATPTEANLFDARVTEWLPPPDQYDFLGADVFNLSGSPAGVAAPKGVKVDDPATTTKETSHWRELSVLLRPIERWANAWAPAAEGGTRPVFVAEHGSVPDPTRPGRRAEWLAAACRYLSSPAGSRYVAASYFDTNEVRLSTWSWTKVGKVWNASATPTGDDSASIAAYGATGRSVRFGGTGACGTG